MRNQTGNQGYQSYQGNEGDSTRQRFSPNTQHQPQFMNSNALPTQMQMMQQMQMEQQQPMMMSQQPHHLQAYRGGGQDMSRNSPTMMGQNMYGDMPAMSPNTTAMAQRAMQHMGNFSGAGHMGAMQTPTSPAQAAAFQQDMMEARALQAASGQGGNQADREEELLLNLLIARRQRSRTSDAPGGRPSLAEELMRIRQHQGRMPQGQSQQAGRGLPSVPGMPPLFSSESAVPPSVSAGHPMNTVGLLSHELNNRNTDSVNFMHHSQDIDDRINRSPHRLMDARSQEMLDFSGRGIKRGHGAGSYDAINLKYQTQIGMTDSPKKKRKHKKKPADMPRRPLSAYNLFFSEERERILKEIDAKDNEGKEKDDDKEKDQDVTEGEDKEKNPEGEEGGEEKEETKPKALLRPLIPSHKKRRPHRKTHGKVSFQELARMVGERWKSLPDDRRQYYQDLAKEDMKRQKAAMEEYYAKQNADKTQSPTKPAELKMEEVKAQPMAEA